MGVVAERLVIRRAAAAKRHARLVRDLDVCAGEQRPITAADIPAIEQLARQLKASIEQDILPENSWQTTLDFNPDDEVSRGKRLKVWMNRMLPIEPVL